MNIITYFTGGTRSHFDEGWMNEISMLNELLNNISWLFSTIKFLVLSIIVQAENVDRSFSLTFPFLVLNGFFFENSSKSIDLFSDLALAFSSAGISKLSNICSIESA